MDISSSADFPVIECNVPVMSFQQQNTIEGNPPTTLLPEGSENNFTAELEHELCLCQVKEKKFIC